MGCSLLPLWGNRGASRIVIGVRLTKKDPLGECNITTYAELFRGWLDEEYAMSNYFGQVSKNERLDAKIQNTAEIFNNNNVTTKN